MERGWKRGRVGGREGGRIGGREGGRIGGRELLHVHVTLPLFL